MRDKEKKKAYDLAYHKANLEKNRARRRVYNRSYREANREKLAELERDRVDSGKRLGAALSEEQLERRRAKHREWNSKNPEKVRAHNRDRAKKTDKTLDNLRQRARYHGVTISQLLEACPSGYAPGYGPRKKSKP